MDVTDAQIAEVLRGSNTPLRAADIVVKLNDGGVLTSREIVNKVLYKGPFDKIVVEGSAAPTWRNRTMVPMTSTKEGHSTIEIDGVGTLTLRDDIHDMQLIDIFTGTAKAVPAGSAKVYSSSDLRRRNVILAAQTQGYVFQDLF